jgi:hypothetical protein
MRGESASVKTVDAQKEVPGDATLYIPRRAAPYIRGWYSGRTRHWGQHKIEPSSEHEPPSRAPAPSINDSVAQMALCSALGRPNEEQGRLKGPCWTFASCAPTIKLCRPDRGVLKQPVRTNQPQTQPGTGQGTCGQTWLGANRPSHVEKELQMPRFKCFATRLDFHVHTGAGAVMRTAGRVARTPFASGAPLHCS